MEDYRKFKSRRSRGGNDAWGDSSPDAAADGGGASGGGGGSPAPDPPAELWHATNKLTGVTISNGGLTATKGGGGYGGGRGETGDLTGKGAMEVTIEVYAFNFSFGISTNIIYNNYVGDGFNYSWGYHSNGNILHAGGVASAVPPIGIVGTKVAMAWDKDAGKIWWGFDGTWEGDPGAGTGALVTDADFTNTTARIAYAVSGTGSVTISTTPTIALPTGFSWL